MSDQSTGVLLRSTAGGRDKKIEKLARGEKSKLMTTCAEHNSEQTVQQLQDFMNQVTDENIVEEATQAWRTETLNEIR